MTTALGWYAYAFAAEPFVVSAVATYVPLLLEELARHNAVWVGDYRTPCRPPNDNPGLMPVPIPPPKCAVRLGPWWIDTASLPLYTFAVSVALQTVVVVSISGLADRGAHRKSLLIFFAIVGSVATIVLGWIGDTHYYVAAALAVVANASFGAVNVCGNAFLPHIVAHERTRLSRLRRTAVDRFQGAFPRAGPGSEPVSVEESARISAHISGRGTATGYGAALFVQVITMIILVRGGRLQLVIALIGWWWLAGQIPVALYLHEELDLEEPDLAEPGRGAPRIGAAAEQRIDRGADEFEDDTPARGAVLDQVAYGWVSLFRTVSHARGLRDVTMFLCGWFLLSDAITTINSTAVLFARTNLQMATPALALIGLITVVFAIAGSLSFGARRSQRNSLVFIAVLASLIPAYGVLGFFQPWIGLKHPWETYVLAAWYGIALGALSTITRSQFTLLIPRGREAMFFALYAVTDKGSSIVGPAITGFITDYTHNIRYTFYFLLGMMIFAAFVFAQVDYERGQRAAEAEAEALETSEPDRL